MGFFSILADTNSFKPLENRLVNKNHGFLLMNGSDTIYYNFGYDVDNLSEMDKKIIFYPGDVSDMWNIIDSTLINKEDVVFVNKPNYDIDELRTQNVRFIQVSGFRVKITFPREINKGGLTGVYIDSVKKTEGGRLKFNLYAKDLDSMQNEELLNAIQTLQFH
ncbi:hypothetical protein EG028_18080 [Chitinophaga barathri]|uniref:Uncharacterized protein n=2 Tax=Chitinophaga barathri TaxID=1647451 RepID=A0A3N4MDA8_9BACT|nr:hypothetical protein EG028_18080 [Chitinophaga barathri]